MDCGTSSYSYVKVESVGCGGVAGAWGVQRTCEAGVQQVFAACCDLFRRCQSGLPKTTLSLASDPSVNPENLIRQTEASHTGLQGESGLGCRLGQEDAGRIGTAVRHSPQPNHPMENAASQRCSRNFWIGQPWRQLGASSGSDGAACRDPRVDAGERLFWRAIIWYVRLSAGTRQVGFSVASYRVTSSRDHECRPCRRRHLSACFDHQR